MHLRPPTWRPVRLFTSPKSTFSLVYIFKIGKGPFSDSTCACDLRCGGRFAFSFLQNGLVRSFILSKSANGQFSKRRCTWALRCSGLFAHLPYENLPMVYFQIVNAPSTTLTRISSPRTISPSTAEHAPTPAHPRMHTDTR